MSAKEKLLLLGADAQWLDRWRQERDTDIIGVVDLYKESPDLPNMRVFSRLQEALTVCKPDFASLVTPPDRKTDLPAIRLLAHSGIDVLLQKLRPEWPDDGEKLLRLANETGRSIGIGEAYRFDKVIDSLCHILDSGQIGTVGEVRWVCRRPQGHSPWKEAYKHVMLEDLTYHHMGALQRLIGLGEGQVYAWSGAPAWSVHPRTSVDMLIKVRGSVSVNYSAAWTAAGAHTTWLGDIAIDGTQGTVTANRDGIILYRRGKLEPEAERIVIPETPPNARADIVSEFLAARRSGDRSATDIRSFIEVTRALQAALISASENRPVEIKGSLRE